MDRCESVVKRKRISCKIWNKPFFYRIKKEEGELVYRLKMKGMT
jgi:hypothetical protein